MFVLLKLAVHCHKENLKKPLASIGQATFTGVQGDRSRTTGDLESISPDEEAGTKRRGRIDVALSPLSGPGGDYVPRMRNITEEFLQNRTNRNTTSKGYCFRRSPEGALSVS